MGQCDGEIRSHLGIFELSLAVHLLRIEDIQKIGCAVPETRSCHGEGLSACFSNPFRRPAAALGRPHFLGMLGDGRSNSC